MTPRFSMVLPVRNGAAYIEQAIRSILGQTNPDFELAVLENASTDGTDRIVAALAARDPRVRVFPSTRPLGMAENWGRIRDLCLSGDIRGEFLSLTGHDDRFEPHFLAVVTRLIGAAPEAALYQTHFRIIDGQGAVTQLSRPMPERETLLDFYLARCWELRDTFGTGYAFRRSDYVAEGGIPPYPRLMFADDMLWLRLMRRGVKVTAPEVCFEYRRHPSNASSEPSPDRFMATLRALALFVEEIERSLPFLLEGEMQREALSRLVVPILRHTEKGSYRLGFSLAAVRREWQELSRRLEERGINAPSPRLRPLKRLWHAVLRSMNPAPTPRA